jgi:ATP-dependent DNA helicase RecQ
VGRFEIVAPIPGSHGVMNSAQRLAAIAHRYRLTGVEEIVDKAILLVDDRTITGWTLAVAARELLSVGATAVHPFVLAADG